VFQSLQILILLLIAVAWAAALAHLLEFPGKMRFNRENYFAVQTVYYPGFTIAGAIGEAGGFIAVLALLLVTPFGTPAFALPLVALLARYGGHYKKVFGAVQGGGC